MANPVLVGAVTTLVVIVAVFLAYNANNGLPFVPTRQFKVQIENGANLVKGNEVRAGGFRVGVISDIKPATLPNGKTVALFTVKLDKKIGDVPADSTADVRPRSALGLKFLQLTKGNSHHFLQDGDTIPLAQTTVPVQFDDGFTDTVRDETPFHRHVAHAPSAKKQGPRRARRQRRTSRSR